MCCRRLLQQARGVSNVIQNRRRVRIWRHVHPSPRGCLGSATPLGVPSQRVSHSGLLHQHPSFVPLRCLHLYIRSPLHAPSPLPTLSRQLCLRCSLPAAPDYLHSYYLTCTAPACLSVSLLRACPRHPSCRLPSPPAPLFRVASPRARASNYPQTSTSPQSRRASSAHPCSKSSITHHLP